MKYINFTKLALILVIYSINLHARISDKPEVIWARQISSSADDYAWDVAVNSIGISHIVGYTNGVIDGAGVNSGEEDFFAIRFGLNGLIGGANFGGSAVSDGYEIVKTDHLNNVYYGGFYNDQRGLINKFDVDGNLVWSNQYQSLSIWTLDSIGDIYGVGIDANQNLILSQHNTNGILVWSKVFSSSLFPRGVNDIAVDLNGDIYLVGNTRADLIATNVGGEDVFIIKLNSIGDVLWSEQIGTSASEWGNALAIDSFGFVYITGKTGGDLGAINQGRTDIYLAKYSSLGILSWVRQFGTSEFEESHDIVIGTDDDIYITGGSQGAIGGFSPGGGSDQFITKFYPSGNLVWTKQISTPVFDEAYGIDLLFEEGALKTDIIYIAGNDYSTTFGDGVLTKLALKDTDGDGLLDVWETEGISYVDSNGIEQRLMIPGADPLHKDLYFEVDSMNGITLSNAVIALITTAFDTSPVTNPDNLTGINLHIFKDNISLPHVNQWQTDGCWPLDFDQTRGLNFGTQNQHNNIELLEAKSMAYRYVVVADEGLPALAGCAELNGDNSVVFLGDADYSDKDNASTLMHEIGHNLGLGHGGGDSLNGKPNYPSIMNYVLGYEFNWNKMFWKLDYSHEGQGIMPVLNENSLNEVAGIGGTNSLYKDFFMPFGVDVAGGQRTIKGVQLNGTRVDFGDLLGTFFQDGQFNTSTDVNFQVSQDLNYAINTSSVDLPSNPSPGQILMPYDDWANIKFPLSAALGTAALEISYPTDELKNEAREWIDANFPVFSDGTDDVIFISGFED